MHELLPSKSWLTQKLRPGRLAACCQRLMASPTRWLASFASRRQMRGWRDRKEAEAAVGWMYRLALGRHGAPEEITGWTNSVLSGSITTAGMVNAIATSDEGRNRGRQNVRLNDLPHGKFVQLAFEILLQRGATAGEITTWAHGLEQAEISRDRLVRQLFGRA